MGVAVVTQKRIQNPLLAFEAREGGVFVPSEGGGGGGEDPLQLMFDVREGVVVIVVAQNKRKTPPLTFGARGVVAIISQSKRNLPPHSHLEQGRGSSLSLLPRTK